MICPYNLECVSKIEDNCSRQDKCIVYTFYEKDRKQQEKDIDKWQRERELSQIKYLNRLL